MILKKENKILSDNEIVAEKLNNVFIETAENLDIGRFYNDLSDNNEAISIEELLKIYKSHPSIIKIKENICVENKFSFDKITSEDFQKLVLDLDSKKVSVVNDIPVKALAKTSDIVSDYLSTTYNNSIHLNEFPNSLKVV